MSHTQTADAEHLYCQYYCEENVYHLAKSLVASQAAQASQGASAIYAVFVSNLDRRNVLLNQKAASPEQGFVIWDYHVFVVVVQSNESLSTSSEDAAAPPPAVRTLEDPRKVQKKYKASIWDLDSTLGLDVPFEDYVEATFRPDLYNEGGLFKSMFEVNEPRFRVVPAQTLLEYFASDRSHMLVMDEDHSSPEQALASDASSKSSRYTYEPPSWPIITSTKAAAIGVGNNLWTRYLDMRFPDEEEPVEHDTIDWADWEERGAIYGRVMSLYDFADLDEWASPKA